MVVVHIWARKLIVCRGTMTLAFLSCWGKKKVYFNSSPSETIVLCQLNCCSLSDPDLKLPLWGPPQTEKRRRFLGPPNYLDIHLLRAAGDRFWFSKRWKCGFEREVHLLDILKNVLRKWGGGDGSEICSTEALQPVVCLNGSEAEGCQNLLLGDLSNP